MAGLLLLAVRRASCDSRRCVPCSSHAAVHLYLRQQLMRDEMQRSSDSKLHLNSTKVKTNRVLMVAKSREIHDGSISSSFIIKRARIRDRSWHGQVRDYLCTNVQRKLRVFPFIIRWCNWSEFIRNSWLALIRSARKTRENPSSNSSTN